MSGNRRHLCEMRQVKGASMQRKQFYQQILPTDEHIQETSGKSGERQVVWGLGEGRAW